MGNEMRLPRVNELPPNLALMILGRALAESYREIGDPPLPASLADILQDIERREATGNSGRKSAPVALRG